MYLHQTCRNPVYSRINPEFPLQANGIIKKLQGNLKALVGKIKVKNTVTVSQEKILQETTEKLQREQRELQDAQQRLRQKEEEVPYQPHMCCQHTSQNLSVHQQSLLFSGNKIKGATGSYSSETGREQGSVKNQ